MSTVQILSGKKPDGRKLSHAQSEYIRIQAVKAVRIKKQSPEDVIKTFGMHRTNIYKWLRWYDANGYEGLKSTKSLGPESRLTVRQERELIKLLLKNPLQLRFEYALWTIDMIVGLISRKFSVNYSKVQVGRLMKKLGLSRQRPLERAIEQDPKKVKDWLTKHYPAIKREAKKEKREIYFSDEAGFHATAQYGSTWAPKGQTPIIKTSGKREKVNVISAINNKGKLRFMLYDENFNGTIFIAFLKRLTHKQKTPISIIVDGHKSHFTKQVKEYIAGTKGKLKLYQLPAYSPELNPDELVWNNAKQKVAKKKHTPTKKTFKEKVKETMTEIQKNTAMNKAFFAEPNVSYAM
jgi:transposase